MELPEALLSRLPWNWRQRAASWGKMLSFFFTAQTINQFLGLATGLLLVRWMEKEVFALYALASSVLTFFAFVTDLGATGSLVYFRRAEATGDGDFGAAVAAVGSLRRVAFLLGAPIAIGFFIVAAYRQRFAAATTWACALVILAGVWAQIGTSLRLQVLRLRGLLMASYAAEIAGNGVRLAGSGALALAGWLMRPAGALWALVATVAGTGLTAALARRSDPERAQVPAPALAEARRRLLRYLAPSLPSGVYFAIQGPLVVWLAATLGDTESLADIGALGRLGLIASVISPLPSVLLLPRLAAVSDERLYWRRAVQFALFFAVLLVPLWLATLAAPEAFLWLLGRHYAGLGRELPLAMGGSILNVYAGYFVGLTRARGWTRWDAHAVACMIAAQALFALLLPLGTLRGLLWFNIGTATTGLLLQAGILVVGRTRTVEPVA
jgi:O-antigen/teichoic acid export membrane protein